MDIRTDIYGWFYTQILKLYPHDFRADFGDEMRIVFRERLADRSGFISSNWFFLHELLDLPVLLLQHYYRQHVWALNTTGSIGVSETLETRLRRESYRRQLTELFKLFLFFVLIIFIVYAHGYLFTVFTLHQSEQEFGIYSTLNDALQASDEQYSHYYHNIRSVTILNKAPLHSDNDFIWYVTANVNAETLADGSPVIPEHTKGGFYYIHTQEGWVPYVDEFWIETGFLSHWMEFYHLDGNAK